MTEAELQLMTEAPKKGENPEFDKAIFDSGYSLSHREMEIAWTFYRGGKAEKPTNEKEIIVQAFYQQGDGPFICGVQGAMTQDAFVEIEQDLIDNAREIFSEGDGDYVFTARHQRSEMDGPYWELDSIRVIDQEGRVVA